MTIELDQILNRISDEISVGTKDLVKDLFAAEQMTSEELVRAISKHDGKIEEVGRTRQDIDVNLAHAISQVCLRLLNENWAQATDLERKLIQMACCYYFEDDDDGGDFDSVFGFDDDAQVLNIVLECIGREDSLIQI
jgi:hypothetical protein